MALLRKNIDSFKLQNQNETEDYLKKESIARMENWSADLNLQELASRFGTPNYVFNLHQLERNFNLFSDLLEEPGRVFYPVKTNPSLCVLESLSRLGASSDCASEYEVRLARTAGIPMTGISFYSPSPDISYLAKIYRSGATVVLDTREQILQLQRLLGGEKGAGKLFVRVKPLERCDYANPNDYQEYTSHGKQSSQFGMGKDELLALHPDISIPLDGLHLHVGTQMDNLEVFEKAMGSLHTLAKIINNNPNHAINILNLGGGLGIPATPNEAYPSLHSFSKLVSKYKNEEYTYRMEPGNALIGNAIGFLSKVKTKKTDSGKTWVILDVGSNQLIKTTIAGFNQTIYDANHNALSFEGKDSIAGPLCFAGDVILKSTDVTNVNQGDPVFLPHCGSYCSSIGSRFNGLPQPGVILVNDEGVLGLGQSSEDLSWEPSLQSYQGDVVASALYSKDNIQIGNDRVEKLQSIYLKECAKKEQYDFTRCIKISEGYYELEVNTKSPVDFVSAPFLMRFIGDAIIVSSLIELNEETKNTPVLGSRFTMTLNQEIPNNTKNICRIKINAFALSSSQAQKCTWAHWSIGDNLAYGKILVTVTN